jgi:2'-5' RNA ligase
MGGSAALNGSTSGAVEYYALVAYLPVALSEFLSTVRNELDPRYPGKPHLTLLPPRRLTCPWGVAWEQVRSILEVTPPIHVGLGDVRLFKESDVVYLELRNGWQDVEKLHRRLNDGLVCSAEVWQYHPHITLAHGTPGQDVLAAAAHAQKRWNEYGFDRSFEIGKLTWVKTTIVPGVHDHGTRSPVASDSQWIDLAEGHLATRVEA